MLGLGSFELSLGAIDGAMLLDVIYKLGYPKKFDEKKAKYLIIGRGITLLILASKVIHNLGTSLMIKLNYYPREKFS